MHRIHCGLGIWGESEKINSLLKGKHKISKAITDLNVIMMQVNTNPARLTWKNSKCPFGVWRFHFQQTGCRWVGAGYIFASVIVLLLHRSGWFILMSFRCFVSAGWWWSQGHVIPSVAWGNTWPFWFDSLKTVNLSNLDSLGWRMLTNFPGFRSLFCCLQSISQSWKAASSYSDKGLVNKKKSHPLIRYTVPAWWEMCVYIVYSWWILQDWTAKKCVTGIHNMAWRMEKYLIPKAHSRCV